ncbi:hypothetical protein OSB04_024582 [Centaurea solstitialis]|uniref:Uncharacterized protein n=1 Tax=Centaurea solstitialis TaxID=347529 RepID=A0AA38SLE0_9ASTR|nr:hypothetical protein OSB04_024582 [Centaurea solstitialis]
MSKEILGIGSETRPPVLVMGEYQQWKRRMIHFLDMLDGNLMKSIREGPIRPTVTVAAVPKTDTCPELPSYVVEKPVEMFNPEQRARHLVDKRALTLLIMALPNDMYARVDSLTNARDVWLEIEQQMQGGDTALESQKESALNAYEGFKARETESLTESYQRLNAFVNDLRRLGIEKTKYEVNVKFLKNLTPAWQNLAINLQLSRNLGIMGLHDLFSMMVQHEEFITGGKFKNAVDPLALAAVPCGGSNSALFQHQQYNNSSPQQYNHSPPQHYQENYNQEFNGNYGSNYQEFNSNYSPSYQGGPGDQGDWRGQVSHINYRQNLRNYTPESGYIDRQGYSSGYEGGQDGRHGRFEGGQGGQGYGQEQERNYRGFEGQTDHGNRNYPEGNHQSESRICELERCLQSERSLVTKFRIDSAIYKSSLEDLTIVYNRETLESSVRESNLSNKLSCLQKTHEKLNSDHGELQIKFQLLSEERTRLFSKIQELEDNNFKRGQSEQTLSILTQHANKNPFYKVRPGLGLSENHVLEKAPSNLYNFEDMAASKPKPALVGGHVTEEFVRQTVTYTEVINGETITTTISPTNSTSSSPPTSPTPNKPIFVPASDPTNTKSTWEGIKARTPRVAMPPINYSDLNTSYDTRKMDFSEETLVIPPEDVSATKSPNLVELEKEMFGLRLKAMDLDACQHQILNLKVLISEKDNLVHTLKKDLIEANAERIRMSSECETAASTFTNFQLKVADLKARYVLLNVHSEIARELDHDEKINYRVALTNQRVSNSILKRKVMYFENLSDSVNDRTTPLLHHPIVDSQTKSVMDPEDYYTLLSDDDEPLNSHHRITEPKTIHDPNVEYDLKVFLDEGDDPSGFIPKGPKSVFVKPEKSVESRAPVSENSNPKGEKCVGTDNGNFEVGETSQLKPKQPFSSTKPKFSKTSSGKGGNSSPIKPSSNSHHARNADGRKKDGGQEVKPPRKNHRGRPNSFQAFPKQHSPNRAGLGYAPPSVGITSNMSVKRNRHLTHAFDSLRNDMCFMFDNFLRYGVYNSFNADVPKIKSRKRRGRKRGKGKPSSSVQSPKPKETSEKETASTNSIVSDPKEPIWQWVPKQA